MQKRTAAKVADLLGLTEAWLEHGRPRKMPGKSRPEAMVYGLPCKITRANAFYTEKISLVGAFKAARIEQGYSKTVEQDAIVEFIIASKNDHLRAFVRGDITAALSLIDDEAWDTRWLRRDLRRARKNVERTYLS